jgi:hypothetical protein
LDFALNAVLVFTKIRRLQRNIISAELNRVIRMVQIILDFALSMDVVFNKIFKLQQIIPNLRLITVILKQNSIMPAVFA